MYKHPKPIRTLNIGDQCNDDQHDIVELYGKACKLIGKKNLNYFIDNSEYSDDVKGFVKYVVQQVRRINKSSPIIHYLYSFEDINIEVSPEYVVSLDIAFFFVYNRVKGPALGIILSDMYELDEHLIDEHMLKYHPKVMAYCFIDSVYPIYVHCYIPYIEKEYVVKYTEKETEEMKEKFKYYLRRLLVDEENKGKLFTSKCPCCNRVRKCFNR